MHDIEKSFKYWIKIADIKYQTETIWIRRLLFSFTHASGKLEKKNMHHYFSTFLESDTRLQDLRYVARLNHLRACFEIPEIVWETSILSHTSFLIFEGVVIFEMRFWRSYNIKLSGSVI